MVALAVFLLRGSPLSDGSLKNLIPATSQSLNIYQPKTPTLEMMFAGDHRWIQDLPKDKIRVIIATGDIIPARSVNYQEASKNNFLWPYEKTAEILKGADITFANLETPLFAGCIPTQEGMRFCGDAKNIEGLVYSGIDIVNLANNHAGNYGIDGINKTMSFLKDNNIQITGTDGPTVIDVRGLKFAFLGYNEIGHKEQGISWAEDEKIKQEIGQARSLADLVVVTFHWGTEYVSQPTNRQRELAHLAIDSGADLIIGNHPHWIQPVEIYKNKMITYAHGNFVFDQMWSQKTKEGVLGKYTFFDKQLIDIEFFPIEIRDYGQPNFVKGDQKENILEEMKNESLKLNSVD